MARFGLALCFIPALALGQNAANKKLAEAAGKCDLKAVTELMDQKAGPPQAGLEEAFAAAMDSKPDEPKGKACLAVVKALLGRGANPDKSRGEGSFMQEARAADRNDLGDAFETAKAMGCGKAGSVLDGIDEKARAFAIKVVLPRCEEGGAEALAGLLTHPDDDLKREAAIGLMRHGVRAIAAVPELTNLMKSGTSELALVAAEALTRIQRPAPPEVEAHLVKRLSSKEPEVINRALMALSSGGVGASINVATLLKYATQTDDPARSGAALEILVAQSDAFSRRVPPLEKKCKGAVPDCRTEPCELAGDFDGNGKLDAARLFAQPGKGEPGVAFVLDSGKCVLWETGADAFTSWRLELSPDKKGTGLAISGGKSGDGILVVRDGKARLDPP